MVNGRICKIINARMWKHWLSCGGSAAVVGRICVNELVCIGENELARH